MKSLSFQRSMIGAKTRELRESRRWTQAELAKALDVSQPRLSQIERGLGSFSAEQFLRIVEIFNVGLDHFANSPIASGTSAAQNALARFGATHLIESELLASAAFDSPTNVVSEVLLAPESPRHITALGPVIVANIDRISLFEIATRAAKLGRQSRLGWLVDTLRAVIAEQTLAAKSSERMVARRVDTVLALFERSGVLQPPHPDGPLDILDSEVRSIKTAERMIAEASPEAKRWRIVTRLRREDFTQALKAARETR